MLPLRNTASLQVLDIMFSPLGRKSKLFEVKPTTGGLYTKGEQPKYPQNAKKAETKGVSFGQGVLALHLDDAARVFRPEISYTGS